MSDFVTLHEVGPRDGLQNEPTLIPTADKIRLINLLGTSGLRHIEVGSFVSPKWVPQMADTTQVLAQIAPTGAQIAVLVPNMKGWEGFIAARQPKTDYQVAVFISASEGFSQSNLGCSIAESVERLAPVIAAAKLAGVAIRGYVSCVTDCPFDGPTAPAAVAHTVGMLRTLAPMPISLGDTIGHGTPHTVAAMLRAVLAETSADNLAGHFHDTGGRAIDNISLSLDMGLRSFDTSVGGLGGCPYAPGAPGNVATEAVLARLHADGLHTGVDADVIAQAAKLAKGMRP
ncbi:MAG: hydroxymethylglutaryl-CoA lyase [Yoonia sp.]|jgi:hydroxymethylglutaryl-CoA lyase